MFTPTQYEVLAGIAFINFTIWMIVAAYYHSAASYQLTVGFSAVFLYDDAWHEAQHQKIRTLQNKAVRCMKLAPIMAASSTGITAVLMILLK